MPRGLRTVAILLWNDLQLSLRSLTLLMLLGIPLVISLVTSYALSPSANAAIKVAMPGAEGSHLALQLSESKLAGQPVIDIVKSGSEVDAMRLLTDGKVEAVIVVPPDVDALLTSGRFVNVKAVVDDRSQGALTAIGLLRDAAASMATLVQPVSLTIRPLRGLTTGQIMLPIWAISVLISAVTLMPGTLARDRREKMMAALLVAPVSFREFVVAKTLFGLIVTTGGAALVLLTNRGFTGAPWLTLAFLVLGAAVFTLMGLLISLLIDNLQTAVTVATLVYVPMLYGTFFAGVPGAVGAVTRLTPGYYVHAAILHSLNGTASWQTDFPYALALGGMAAGLLVLCIWAVRRQEF